MGRKARAGARPTIIADLDPPALCARGRLLFLLKGTTTMAKRLRGLWKARIVAALAQCGEGHFNELGRTCRLSDPTALSRN
jgi:hypothetical protein